MLAAWCFGEAIKFDETTVFTFEAVSMKSDKYGEENYRNIKTERKS